MLPQDPDPITPQLRVLSEKQCREIYRAALECLSRIGVLVNSLAGRQLLASSGARVEGERVYLPSSMVEEALKTAPGSFTLWGRQPGRERLVKPGQVSFGPGPSCTYFIDPVTLERRRARRGDAAYTAALCEALPNIDYVMSLSLYDDVTPILSPVYEYADMVANTTKPVVVWANNPDTLGDIYSIAAAAAGGEEILRQRPILAYFANYESPLRHGAAQVDNLLWAAQHHLPVIYLGGPTVGLESPVTGASGLVLYLASALTGMVLVQLQQPGVPVVIGGVPSAMDLRTARPAYGSPEMSLHATAAAELAHFLGLPFMGTAGASESKRLDAQAGAEAAVQVLMSSLSGASLVHDLGFLDCADIGSLPYLVFLDEVIGLVKRILRGVEVSAETLMLDLIEQVGPGGHFVAEPRSVSLCRKEIWVPGLFDRNAFTVWEQQGAQEIEQLSARRMRKLLDAHQPPPLPPGAQEQITAVLQAAEERERQPRP